MNVTGGKVSQRGDVWRSLASIAQLSGGYPYFIQFICREVYDVWIQRISAGEETGIPTEEITRKLDTDFLLVDGGALPTDSAN